MESHLVRIINRFEVGKRRRKFKTYLNAKELLLQKLHTATTKKTSNFTPSRDVEARETYTFDSIDLIAMEIYELLY